MNTTQCIQLLLDAFDHPLPLSRHAAIIATAFEEGEVAVHIEERFLLAYIFCFFSQFSFITNGPPDMDPPSLVFLLDQPSIILN